MTSTNHYQTASFMLGVQHLKQLPPDQGMEVAFAGRSNAGKSSALNAITQQSRLARTSKTPGRTQQINMFRLDDERRLADLPGYGYAKVPLEVKAHWSKVLEQYLTTRGCLRGVILLMDVRHPLTEFDLIMLDWCRSVEMPVHVLLTKADKLRRGPTLNVLRQVRNALAAYPKASAQLFSAQTGAGVEEARAVLDMWYGYQ